jgi:uncharacterized Zn-finger protein
MVNFVPSGNRIDLNKRVLKVNESEWPPDVMSLQNKKEREIPAKESIETTSFNTEPITPDQPTHPVDPDLISLSVESKDEDNTRQLLLELLSNCEVVPFLCENNFHFLQEL